MSRSYNAKPTVDPTLLQETQRLRHDAQDLRRDNDYLTQEVNDLKHNLDLA